jgi:methionyl-tRNA formyltransferase
VFFGTPAWAVPSLEALLASPIEVAAVVTNPDRPAGRGLRTRTSPVKARASRAGVALLQPPSARDPSLQEAVADLAPDVCVVVAYGRILPGALLAVPRLGFVNLHFSLLPAYRGPAPVQRALLDGASETGVSVMLLTEGLDEGPLLATASTPVRPDDNAGTLGDRLARLGAPLLVRSIEAYASGELRPRPQDHRRATHAPKVSTEEARIDWTRPAAEIVNLVRACNPEPGAWTTLRGSRVKVYAAAPAAPRAALEPGRVRADGGLVAGAGDGGVALLEVQVAGRRRVSGEEAARGLRLAEEEAFG